MGPLAHCFTHMHKQMAKCIGSNPFRMSNLSWARTSKSNSLCKLFNTIFHDMQGRSKTLNPYFPGRATPWVRSNTLTLASHLNFHGSILAPPLSRSLPRGTTYWNVTILSRDSIVQLSISLNLSFVIRTPYATSFIFNPSFLRCWYLYYLEEA